MPLSPVGSRDEHGFRQLVESGGERRSARAEGHERVVTSAKGGEQRVEQGELLTPETCPVAALVPHEEHQLVAWDRCHEAEEVVEAAGPQRLGDHHTLVEAMVEHAVVQRFVVYLDALL